MKSLLSILIALCAVLALAERQPLSRYQTIIDRQMFGQPPPGFDPSKPASEVSASSRAEQKELTQEQQKLQSAVQFSVINITPEGETAVGFSDNSDPKAPKHYYLKVGEERDGWLVKEANPAEASMTIAKGEIEVSLRIGENSAKNGTTAKTDAAAGTAGGVAERRPNAVGGGLLGSLRGRRMLRRQEEQANAEKLRKENEAKEAQREAAAEAEKAERAAEREQQRQQLLAIQEELRRAREARQQNQQESPGNGGNDAE